MSAYTDKVPPALSEVVYPPLEVGSGSQSFEEGSYLCFMYLKKKKKKFKIEQCHKLLLVLGVGLALTRSYSERWQVVRIGLCGRGVRRA